MSRAGFAALLVCAGLTGSLAQSMVRAEKSGGDGHAVVRASVAAADTATPPAGGRATPATLLRPQHVVAASVCWLESSFAQADCAALLHVLMRRAERAGVPLVEMAWRYSALRRNHARAALARALPDGDEPTWTAAINRRWSALRETALGVLNGSVADPCPGATQWGGMGLHADERRARAALASGRWVHARCAVGTANTFFREVKR